MVWLAKIRWRIKHDCRELKTGLGLDHIEGRSFTGWHRHVTLACTAQAFCNLLRLDPKRLVGLTLYAILRELQPLLAVMTCATSRGGRSAVRTQRYVRHPKVTVDAVSAQVARNGVASRLGAIVIR